MFWWNLINNNGYKTALFTAVEQNNIEIVNLLLKNNNIDVNIKYIHNCF